jgi:hypothetical protein
MFHYNKTCNPTKQTHCVLPFLRLSFTYCIVYRYLYLYITARVYRDMGNRILFHIVISCWFCLVATTTIRQEKKKSLVSLTAPAFSFFLYTKMNVDMFDFVLLLTSWEIIGIVPPLRPSAAHFNLIFSYQLKPSNPRKRKGKYTIVRLVLCVICRPATDCGA